MSAGPRVFRAARIAAVGLLPLVMAACALKHKEAYCFEGCAGTDQVVAEGGRSSYVGTGGNSLRTEPLPTAASGAGPGGPGACVYTGEEVCDGKDNDCDGEVDEGIDFTDPHHCGNCDTNCVTLLRSVTEPLCKPPKKLDGSKAGTCTYEKCALDYYDIDPKVPGCEYYCDSNPDGTVKKDLGGAQGCGRDDDCDGKVDEDVDTCADVDNCGRCARQCVILHGKARCVSTAASGEACNESNTECQIAECNKGFWDANGFAEDGCEYECTADGPEVCDGKDNDCDGKIDNADPDLEDAEGLGESCQGGELGICAAPEHAGIGKCIGGTLVCCDAKSNDAKGTNPKLPATGVRNGVCNVDNGPQVLGPGERLELCNGLDDDCDGHIDDAPIDVGGPCGSSVGSCSPGISVCDTDSASPTFGSLVCEGARTPSTDVCNGTDDDCDGVVDGSAIVPLTSCDDDSDCVGANRLCMHRESGGSVCAYPAADSGTQCDVPPPPPTGAVSACVPGRTACRGGELFCEGAVTRDIGTPDTCGVDENCDGEVATFDLTSIKSCGSCDNDCTKAGAHADWTCDTAADRCVQHGCQTDWYDCAKDDGDLCETFCHPTGEEVCNGIDDDCNCSVDDHLSADAENVCGVRSTAHPGCSPTVRCRNGAWECTFSDPDICTGGDCANTLDDTCDGKDNDCDGIIDNLFIDQLGKPCTKEVGFCTNRGTFVCDPATKDIMCSAPDPVTGPEQCNGLDDDCDGSIDETKADSQGAKDGIYVEPAVVQLGSTGPWIFAYEASRPRATATSPGSGNGYFQVAPPGEPLDSTRPCSVSGRLPWTNVSPWEVEQACAAVGGRVCRPSDWQTACASSSGTCSLGFLGCEDESDYSAGPFCNLGGYDPDAAAGDQDLLLPTGSSNLEDCAAWWAGENGNLLDAFDITGNAREAVRCQKDRAACEGECPDCCAGANVATTVGTPGAPRLCGSLVDVRRLSGQPCASDAECCQDDVNCTGSGQCINGICAPADATDSCVARGIACHDANHDGNCDEYGGDQVACCEDAPLSEDVCGGSLVRPHSVYPLMGGSYVTPTDTAAECSYDFFKVTWPLRLFDAGFRCCFDTDPR